MRLPCPVRRILVAILVYLVLSVIAGVLLCEGTLHPLRRPLTPANESAAREIAQAHHATLREVSLETADRVTLRAWLLVPDRSNASAVILLHAVWA